MTAPTAGTPAAPTSATPTITRLKLPALRRYVESSAWAIHEEKGAALLELFEARVNGGTAAPRADDLDRARRQFEARANDRRPITKAGGAIAVLPFYGVVAQRMDMMMAYCGGVSTEAFADVFDAAMADPNVSAIVIDCDSPGGNVQGTPELAKRVLAARGKGKKIIAVANGTMASAAYWICSAADEVVCTPSGDVGSIGVFCVHVDQSAMNEMIGLKYTLIKAGDHKAEANPWEPLSPDAEAFMKTQVDELNAMFVAAVAKQRGTDAKTVNTEFGQGRCFTAKQALAAGMIDRIATLEDTLKGLGAKNVGASGRPVSANASGSATPPVQAIASITATSESTSPDDVDVDDDDDGDLCPECGAALDDDGKCTSDDCDYVATSSTTATPSATQSTSDGNAPPVTTNSTEANESNASEAGAAATITHSPENRPDAAREETVSQNSTAATGAADPVAIERKRVAEIRTLGRDHKANGITEADIDAMIDSGMSYEAATQEILGKIRGHHAASPTIHVGAPRETQKPFDTFGDQLQAIIKYERSGHRNIDPRLLPQAAASGMSESVPSDGGFAIQPDFASEIITRMHDQGEVISRVRKVPISAQSNGLKINAVDETSRANGSRFGGIQVLWAAEADQGTGKKPKLREIELNLKKLIGTWFLTDELADDTTAMSDIALQGFTEEVTFVTEDAIFNGDGVGKPIGLMKSAALVSQAAEGSQTATTFNVANAAKMFGRMYTRGMKNAAWFINQDVWQQLLQLTIGSSQWPVFMPPGGVSEAPYGTLYGRPVVPIEYCQSLGTTGDVVLADLTQYLVIDKGGPKQAQSIHVKFLTDELTFRITYRVDGQPVWNKALTPKNGSSTVSPYVALAAR
ncbi:MAG TPA: phage major capsid protein [Casimicrobiaceae bacterium]|jgi:HK97 family phage major capsid protein